MPCQQKYDYIPVLLDLWYFKTLELDGAFDTRPYLCGFWSSISGKYFRWGDEETTRDTQSSSKSLGIGVSHPLHHESLGRNGIRWAGGHWLHPWASGRKGGLQRAAAKWTSAWLNGHWVGKQLWCDLWPPTAPEKKAFFFLLFLKKWLNESTYRKSLEGREWSGWTGGRVQGPHLAQTLKEGTMGWREGRGGRLRPNNHLQTLRRTME